jgi:glycosyltransferase involved in cell wall biosynthesis
VTASSTDGSAPVRTPQLSVVVASVNTNALLRQSLAALVAQAAPERIEVVVVRDAQRSDSGDRAMARAQFPCVRWVDAAPGSTVPQLRDRGFMESRGDIVAFIEDDCVVRPGWCEAAIAALHGLAIAVGGAVEPGAYRRAIDWAVYFCEYGQFMLPVSSAATASLPGNNVVYQRHALGRDGFCDVFVPSTVRRADAATAVTDTLVVENVNSWSMRHVTSVPYHHGRAYAGKRFGPRGPMTRVAIGVGALSLPAVKSFRIVVATLSRKRLVGKLIQALPFVLLFTTSWSLGETMGCLFGAGDSPSRWR